MSFDHPRVLMIAPANEHASIRARLAELAVGSSNVVLVTQEEADALMVPPQIQIPTFPTKWIESVNRATRQCDALSEATRRAMDGLRADARKPSRAERRAAQRRGR